MMMFGCLNPLQPPNPLYCTAPLPSPTLPGTPRLPALQPQWRLRGEAGAAQDGAAGAERGTQQGV